MGGMHHHAFLIVAVCGITTVSAINSDARHPSRVRIQQSSVASIAVTSVGSVAAQASPWSEQIPDIETVLQMARLSELMYYYKEIDGFDFKELKGKTSAQLAKLFPESPGAQKVLLNLKDAAENLVVEHFYNTSAGTEVAVLVSQTNARVSVVFRGTSEANDMATDLKFLKRQLAPDGTKPTDADGGAIVHRGFRAQYYAPLVSGEVASRMQPASSFRPFLMMVACSPSLRVSAARGRAVR